MTLADLNIRGWGDLAEVATVLSLPVIVLAVVMTGRQISAQFTASRREASFEVYLRFSEKFSEIMALQVELAERFDARDKTLNLKSVSRYYVQYWILQINYWEMFRAGLLPVGIYAPWLVYTHDSMAGDALLGYFDARGKPQTLSSKAAFELIFLRRMLRGQPEGAAFFRDLAAIPHGWSRDAGFEIHDEPDLDARVAAITALVTARQAEYRARPLWKVH